MRPQSGRCCRRPGVPPRPAERDAGCVGDRAGALVNQNDGEGLDDEEEEKRPDLRAQDCDCEYEEFIVGGGGKLDAREVAVLAACSAFDEDALFVFGYGRGPAGDADGTTGRRALSRGGDFGSQDVARSRGEEERTSAG